jgi:hypothetical protein
MQEKLQGASANYGCWPKEGKRGKDKKKRFVVLKGDQAIGFKYKFEFNQSKIMHQHVCNKHQATYLIWKKIIFFLYNVPVKY